jgi:hypothetical protein
MSIIDILNHEYGNIEPLQSLIEWLINLGESGRRSNLQVVAPTLKAT